MEIKELKRLLLDLIMPPSDDFVKKIRRWEKVFNSNFSFENAYDNLDISREDILALEENPSIDSNAVKNFFDKALPFYTPENCLLSKPTKPKVIGSKEALNEEQLFDLFKKIFDPFTDVDKSEVNEIIEKFNTNFVSDDFYEILFDEFNWDEIVEDPDMYDEEIKIRIKQELLKNSNL